MRTYVVECEHNGNEVVITFNEIVELDDNSKYNDTDLIERIYYASKGNSYEELPRPNCYEINNLSEGQKQLLKDVGGIEFRDESFLEEYESWISDEDEEEEDYNEEEDY